MSAFAAIFAAIGYVKNTVGERQRLEFFESKKTLLSLKQMSWKEFEHFVGTFFEKQGYTVEVTGGLRDGGIDLIVRKSGRTSYVQCKKYRENQVTLSMMRDFYGAISSQANTNPGFFVTTGTFTLDARKFAEENGNFWGPGLYCCTLCKRDMLQVFLGGVAGNVVADVAFRSIRICWRELVAGR